MSQLERWTGKWGDDYTERNHLTAEDQLPLFRKILFNLEPELSSILEVGCGTGHNVRALELLFPHACVFGVEPNKKAATIAMQKSPLVGDYMDIYDLGWFPDGTIDLAFTMGVLIHIPPDRLLEAMTEMFRISRKYILAIEYFSVKPVMVEYRGEKDMLWKRDFGAMYLDNFRLQLLRCGVVMHLGEELSWWLMTK